MRIKQYLIFLLAIFLAFSISALEIESPIETTYTTTDVPLIITSNTSLDTITYQLNNETPIIACQNCTNVNDTLSLTEGNYTLLVRGIIENQTIQENVSFNIILPVNETPGDNETQEDNFSLSLTSPINTTYNDLEVQLNIEADKVIDQISYILNSANKTILCQNCSSYNTTITASEGSNSLIVKGILNVTEKQVTVNFFVELPQNQTNQTNENETKPRFSLGFNKLPKLVMMGDITDEELAEIIRSNAINPGIINRLIKTGRLGEESIQAILDTQFNPPGILRKLLGFIGFKHKSHAELIYENYNLTETGQQKLLMRDDLPEEYTNKIKQNLQKKLEKKITKINETSETKPKNRNFAFKKREDKPAKKETKKGQSQIQPKKQESTKVSYKADDNTGQKDKSLKSKPSKSSKSSGKSSSNGKSSGKNSSSGKGNGKNK